MVEGTLQFWKCPCAFLFFTFLSVAKQKEVQQLCYDKGVSWVCIQPVPDLKRGLQKIQFNCPLLGSLTSSKHGATGICCLLLVNVWDGFIIENLGMNSASKVKGNNKFQELTLIPENNTLIPHTEILTMKDEEVKLLPEWISGTQILRMETLNEVYEKTCGWQTLKRSHDMLWCFPDCVKFLKGVVL